MDQKAERTMRKKALALLQKARITVTPGERRAMEVADFGLDDVGTIGVELVVYENNDRYCAKELIMLPGQTCPEHRHPPMDERNIGKMETFRCRWGLVYLYTEGQPARRIKARIPKSRAHYFTVRKEIVMKPGDQYTLLPNTLHWFQAGPRGAIISEFSSTSHDDTDVFTDPDIRRVPADNA